MLHLWNILTLFNTLCVKPMNSSFK